MGRVRTAKLTELSGLAASYRTPGVMWAHNDSGSEPLLYCLRFRGAPCGVWKVAGASALDWEDMAAAPGPGGVNSLYIGDIGDNARTRSEVVVYRVREPDIAFGGGTLEAEAITLTYPDRPHDAESLFVQRETGDLYVVTKESDRARVYVARAPLEAQMQLELVAKIEIPGLLPGPTGASLSPDGRRVIFSTYSGGYEFKVSRASFDDIWKQEPAEVDLGDHAQNEAVTYTVSGNRVISTSEGKQSPIYAVERKR